MTFFRAHYDEQGHMVLCEKVVYGEVEPTHRYTDHPDGTLRRGQIADEDDGLRVLDFDLGGERLA